MKHLSLNKKPLEIDDFNNMEEQEVNKKIEKRKKIDAKQLKKQINKTKKKLDEEKMEEKELWDRLNESNKKFQIINNKLKRSKKNA